MSEAQQSPLTLTSSRGALPAHSLLSLFHTREPKTADGERTYLFPPSASSARAPRLDAAATDQTSLGGTDRQPEGRGDDPYDRMLRGYRLHGPEQARRKVGRPARGAHTTPALSVASVRCVLMVSAPLQKQRLHNLAMKNIRNEELRQLNDESREDPCNRARSAS